MSDLVRFWYGGLFLFASYYTLMKEGHVRVDVLYTNFSGKNKALVLIETNNFNEKKIKTLVTDIFKIKDKKETPPIIYLQT